MSRLSDEFRIVSEEFPEAHSEEQVARAAARTGIVIGFGLFTDDSARVNHLSGQQIRSMTVRGILQYFCSGSPEIGCAHQANVDHTNSNHMGLPSQIIDSPRVPRIGPYSQAIRVGCLVYTAGQTGIDPATGVVAGSSFEAQARQAFANLQAVLEDAGTSLAHVIKVTCFLADPDAFLLLNALFEELFPATAPVRSTPIVRLPGGLLFSIDAIAVVGI